MNQTGSLRENWAGDQSGEGANSSQKAGKVRCWCCPPLPAFSWHRKRASRREGNTDLMEGACMSAQLLSPFQLFATPWTIAHQTPLYFSSKDTGGGCHLLMYTCKKKKKSQWKNLMKVYKGSLTAFSMKVLDTRGKSTLSYHSTRQSNLHFKNGNVYMPGVLRHRLWDFWATTRNHDLASPEWEADFL